MRKIRYLIVATLIVLACLCFCYKPQTVYAVTSNFTFTSIKSGYLFGFFKDSQNRMYYCDIDGAGVYRNTQRYDLLDIVQNYNPENSDESPEAPCDVAEDANGNIWILIIGDNPGLLKFSSTFTYISSVISYANITGSAMGIAIDKSTNKMYIALSNKTYLVCYNINTGTFTQTKSDPLLTSPSCLDIDNSGNISVIRTVTN